MKEEYMQDSTLAPEIAFVSIPSRLAGRLQMKDSTLDPEIAFDLRCEARDAARIARAAAAGHTHTVCPRCGDVRTLGWLGGECNNYDPYTEDELCGGVYRAAGGTA